MILTEPIYKGTFESHEVWINMMESFSVAPKLEKIFGKIPSPLPYGCLRVEFRVIKEGTSWIKANEKEIKFTYEIKGSRIRGKWYHDLILEGKLEDKDFSYSIELKTDDIFPKTLVRLLIRELIRDEQL